MDKKEIKNLNILRRIILILAIVIFIIIGIILTVLMNPVENRLTYIYDNNENWSITKMPKNVSPLFAEYQGIIENTSIYKAMNLFVEEIVEEYYIKFKGNFNQEKIGEYYKQNTLTINRELGIESKEAFVEFVKSLEKLRGDELVLKDYIIIPDSIKQVTRGLQFVLAVDYENNERMLFTLKILNKSSTDVTPINYSAAEYEQKYMEYGKENTEKPKTVEAQIGTGKVIQ